MDRLVYIITLGIRPRRLQAWYRRHPKTVLVGDGAVLAYYVVRGVRRFKELNGRNVW